jgi:hypothetical protein
MKINRRDAVFIFWETNIKHVEQGWAQRYEHKKAVKK